MISTNDLLRKLDGNSCLIALKGSIRERQKGSKGGNPIGSLTPHYAERDNPTVAYQGDAPNPAFVKMNGAEIEFVLDLAAQEHPYPEVFTGQKPSYFTQLQYGSQGLAPSADELSCLLEAGRAFQRIKGQPVLLVAVPVVVAGQAVMAGRLFPVGIFSLDGEALWLEPRAIERGLIKAEFPANQRTRSLKGTTGVGGASASQHWFESNLTQAQGEGLVGVEATHRALNIRVEFLAAQGFPEEQSREAAYKQYEAFAMESLGMALPNPWKGGAKGGPAAPATGKPVATPARAQAAKAAAKNDLTKKKK